MRVEEYVNLANERRYKNVFPNFKKNVFIHTLKWEGGGKLHNVSGDSGGWTIWGIAYNHNKEVFKDLNDFKDTTYDEAAAIAFVKYFLSSGADYVPANHQLMYFDTAYNLGVPRAITLAQRCIGVKDDGILGPMTKSKLILLTEDCIYQGRKGWYNYLVKTNVKFNKFIKGWMNRANDILSK